MHCRGVDQQVLDFEVGIFFREDARRHVPPEPRGVEHIGFVDGSDLAFTCPRQIRRRPADALYLGYRVLARVEGKIVLAIALAEIDPARQLAHDHDIHA